MEPWTIGLVAVIVVGLGVILYGALSDRSRNRRAEEQMLAPPQRVIPQFSPDAPAPTYLSELQARRRPEDAGPAALSPAQRQEVGRQLEDPSTTRIDAGYLSRDFITDPGSSWAVLESPRVLVCAEPVGSTRELLGVLERFVLTRSPLVLVAPEFSSEVRTTLEVNVIKRTLSVLAVALDRDALPVVAGATGAVIRSRSDLQAGYVWPEHLGSCPRWVSDARRSYLISSLG